ncbi:MAG: histidine kinase [Spirochaetaceae bacterium]
MRSLWRSLSLQNKHLLFFGVIILVFAALMTYVVYTATEYTDVFQENLDSYFTIHQFQRNLTESRDYLSEYMRSGNEEALKAYGASMPKLWDLLNRLENEIEPTYPGRFHMTATRYGLHAYGAAASKAISEKTEGAKGFYLTYEWAVRVSRYVDTYITELFRLSLAEGSESYSVYRAQAEQVPRTAALGVGVIALLLIGFALLFSRTVTHPLHELAIASRRMAAGELDLPAVRVPPGDEVGTLTESFNSMSENIRRLVADLKDKQELQRRLHEEELKNVSMQRSLREAQLIGLQTQINPHFLFNTLNAIARTATGENATQSAALIRSLSKVFRYLLRNPASMVSLAAELQLVEEYMQIQIHRFGDRLTYRLDCEVEAESIEVPVLILQPLVENAVRYGVEPSEEGGEVVVSALLSGEDLQLSVRDDGVGMTTARARRLMRYEESASSAQQEPENRSGIGIQNVLHRLRLTYQGRESFRISSAPGKGTEVEIRLPMREEERVSFAHS